MSREDPQVRVRLPPDLKNNIEESAKNNRRSMNAEIITRLNNSYQYENNNKSVNAKSPDTLVPFESVSDLTQRLIKVELPEYIANVSKEIMSDAYIEKICALAREQAEKDWKERLNKID